MTASRFRIRFRGRRIAVEVNGAGVVYRLLDGDPVTVEHAGESFVLDGEVTRPSAPQLVLTGPPPTQPAGREPVGRGGLPAESADG